jgi:putative oxygen-independent coproporphyrinogen III oxidase
MKNNNSETSIQLNQLHQRHKTNVVREKIIPSIQLAQTTHNLNTQLTILPPLSLYIHIPWCEKKCPYCDFNSHEYNIANMASKTLSPEIEQRYILALENDIIATLPLIWGRSIRTVFIGGGTPSLMSAVGMAKIMQLLYTLLPMQTCTEITVEANPSSAEADKFKAFKDAGINRLSLGIQSFNDAHLKQLGRMHNSTQAKHAIDSAQKIFDNINLDIMYALPQQNITDCHADIQQALAFDTQHLSCYHLTLEPNTYFAKYPPQQLPHEDDAYAMQDMLIQSLQQKGFMRYEVSAYSKNKNTQSQHNLNYWGFGDYIGIGAGAHGKISFHDKIMRYVKHKHPQTYMEHACNLDSALNNAHIIEERQLYIADLPFEFMLGGLRLVDGIDVQNFINYTGLGYHYIADTLDIAQKKGLLCIHMHNNTLNSEQPKKIQTTAKGMDFLNDLQMLFLS